MSRITALSRRYSACASLVQDGVEVIAVGDRVGARFDLAVRRLIAALHQDGPELWDDLAGPSRLLRWHLITQPQPLIFHQRLKELTGEVIRQVDLLRKAVLDQDILNDIEASAKALADSNQEPYVGTELLNLCLEVGGDACVVIAGSKPAQLGLTSWLAKYGISVMTVGELEQKQPYREQTYVVGPPRYFQSLITAPVTDRVSFVMPAWFTDRSIPRSALAQYAEGAISIDARVFIVGDTSEPETNTQIEVEDKDSYLPQPVWNLLSLENHKPTNEEVNAHKILLSGNWAIWLDDGERIRSLDPRQPKGERVTYTEVAAVREGTYLLLRKGATERAALYEAALAGLGPKAAGVKATQEWWKQLLIRRLRQHSDQQVEEDLNAIGVKAAERSQAWVDPYLIRPQSDQDFKLLLGWLGIPIQPTFDNASLLRKMRSRASAEIKKQLETAVSAADLTELESTGHISLDLQTKGFRGILATRVLAMSPHSEVVPRHDARIPFKDWSGQWLE